MKTPGTLLSIFILTIQTAFAQSVQWSIGPHISVDRFNEREYEVALYGSFPEKLHWGVSLGVVAQRTTAVDGLTLRGGLLYVQRRWSDETWFFTPFPLVTPEDPDPEPTRVDVESSYTVGFSRIPLLVSYEYRRFVVALGPSLDITLHQRSDGSVTYDPPLPPPNPDTELIVFEANQENPLALGVWGELAYTWPLFSSYQLLTGIRYNRTLTSRLDNSGFFDSNIKIINYGLTFTLLKTL